MSSSDLHEELPAPHFEDRLWRLLADAHGQGSRSTTAERRPGRAPARRGRRMLAAGVGSIAAAAAVIATIAVVGSGDPDSTADRTSAPEPAPGAPAEVDLAAQITAATQQATADSVVHIVQDHTDGPGDSESWSDEASGVSRWLFLGEDGAPSLDSGLVEAPAVDAVGPPPTTPDEECEIQLEPAQTSQSAEPAVVEGCLQEPGPADGPTVLARDVDYCFGEYIEVERPALPARNQAEVVGEWLAGGRLVEDGTEIIDGRELIRLRTPGEWSEHTYYVDPETYRPVQLHGYPDDAGVPLYVMTFEYLPRTPDNLALLVAPVPEGFVQADDLHTDGERYDAGCGL